jgi:hypothetical protein
MELHRAAPVTAPGSKRLWVLRVEDTRAGVPGFPLTPFRDPHPPLSQSGSLSHLYTGFCSNDGHGAPDGGGINFRIPTGLPYLSLGQASVAFQAGSPLSSQKDSARTSASKQDFDTNGVDVDVKVMIRE